MSVAFYGTQETVVSFEAGSAAAGYPVSMSGNSKVSNAPDGAAPVGICLHVRSGIAAVQMKGYAEVSYTGTAPALGWASILSNGQGGVKTGAGGVSCLVVSVDTAAKTLGLYL